MRCCASSGTTAGDIEDPNPATRTPWFQSNWLTIDAGGHDEILLTASSTTNLVHWRLIIDTRIGDRRQSLVVDQNGTPFRTTGPAATGYRRTVALDWARALDPAPGATPADFLTVYDDYTYEIEPEPSPAPTRMQTIIRAMRRARRY